MDDRQRNKRKAKDEEENKEKDLGRGNVIKQWIEEDQDGNLGLSTLVLIYSYSLALKCSLNSK